MFKYPRTPHLQGSRKQPGDEDLEGVPLVRLAGRNVVVEEKIDGANAGISFDEHGALQLQSRGHFLTGGPREKHFNLLKAWASAHQDALHRALGSRHLLYGEWLYAKHTVFYDALPHLFLEFDVLDTRTGEFLDTPRRRALLQGCPVVSVPVLQQGPAPTARQLQTLIRPSLYKTRAWRTSLRQVCIDHGLDPERAARETDDDDLAEGLYLKVEEGGRVVERYKFVRASFLNSILDSGSHWLNRPIVPNGLAPGIDLFEPSP
jgi:hypothetical protein